MRAPSNENNLISLQSSDGQLFEIDVKAACISRLIKDAIDIDSIEDDGYDAEDDELTTNSSTAITSTHPPMELYNVKAECLQNVVIFMKHYAMEPMNPISTPLQGESIEDIVSPSWYRNFAEGLQGEMVYELVAASNYMDVQPLFRLMCLVVTVKLAGKSAEEVRVLLGIPKMTEQEELRAREEHRWLFEEN